MDVSKNVNFGLHTKLFGSQVNFAIVLCHPGGGGLQSQVPFQYYC